MYETTNCYDFPSPPIYVSCAGSLILDGVVTPVVQWNVSIVIPSHAVEMQ
jgi:hypothetical protein